MGAPAAVIVFMLAAPPASAQTSHASHSDAEFGAAVSAAGSLIRSGLEAKQFSRASLCAAGEGRQGPCAAVGGADLETLFAFALKNGGYEAFCRENGCRPSAVILVEPSEHVRKDHSGWYNDGNSYIKNRPSSLSLEITTVHELTHHLQRLSNRYQQYRGICNQYLSEKEAYEAGEAYAKSRGFTTRFETRLAPYEKRCRDAIAAGIVKPPAGLTFDR